MTRFLAIFVVAILWTGASATADEFSGTVDRVVDGDTFWVCDGTACHKIRLCGADAPEKGEDRYRESAEALEALVRGKSVHCVQVGGGTPCDGRSRPTNRDRIVAQCFVGEIDIAGWKALILAAIG